MKIRNTNILLLLVFMLAGCARRMVAPLPVAESVHVSLGNPTAAKADTADGDNYLIMRKQYALSYNRSLGHANWVSWELSADWLGDADRQDDFRPDPVPAFRLVPGQARRLHGVGLRPGPPLPLGFSQRVESG